MTSKTKNSRSFILQQKNSFTNYEDNYQTASDLDENSLFDDHRVPHFGGQQEEYRFSNDDLDSPLGDNMESDEEDEADLLSELRQLSRNMTTSSGGKKRSKVLVDDLVEDEDKPKKSVKEFDEYYQKTFKRFLTKKESDIEKLRRQKEESETRQLKSKPELVAKQQKRKHVPIAERVELIQAKKERELMKMKKQQEEKKEKEFSELTFKPKINQNYVLDHVVVKKGEDSPMIKKYQSNKEVWEINDLNTMGIGKAKSNKNTSAAIQKGVTEHNQKDIVDKLYANTQSSQTNQGNKAKKQDIVAQQPSTSPLQSNRITHKIARSTTEVLDSTTAKQTDNKKSVLTHAKTQDIPAETTKIVLIKDQRESSGSPTRELENRNYRSQNRPERTEDFLNVQEQFMQKLYETTKASSPQKKVDNNILESLMKHYSQQKSQGGQPERQSVESKPIPNKMESPRDKSPLANRGPEKKPENKKAVENISPSKEALSPTKASKPLTKAITPQSSLLAESIREETAEDHEEENEMASIKQNILSIQDNIQSLKLSFKNFQEAQAAPKVESSTSIGTPRKIEKVSLNGNQQVSQQAPEKKISQPPNNTSTNQIQPITVRKEVPVPVVENRSKTPPPPSTGTVTVVKKNSSPVDNRIKNASPTPAQKKNVSIIKISSEEGGYAKRAARPVQEQQIIQKGEEKKENYSSVREVEPPSFGNLSFANDKQTVEVKEDKQIKKEEAYSSVKSKGEAVVNQQRGLEPAGYYSKPKGEDNTQSLKDIAQMTMMKFKGLGQKSGGAGEGYATGYASMKRVNK